MANKMGTGWPPKRQHNKPPKSKAALAAALAVHDKYQRIAFEIRARYNVADQAHWGSGGKHWCGWLDPEVPESSTCREWRGLLASKGGETKATPTASPAEQLEDIAKRRVKLERERTDCDRELVELVRSKSVPVARIAKRIGVSRQAVYQLAATP